MAKRDADVAQQRYEPVRRSVLAGIKAAYFQVSHLSRTLGTLESDGELLQQVEKAANARYRSGMGNQHDLLQAQLEEQNFSGKSLCTISKSPSRRRKLSIFLIANNPLTGLSLHEEGTNR